jgi:hypothetical protein
LPIAEVELSDSLGGEAMNGGKAKNSARVTLAISLGDAAPVLSRCRFSLTPTQSDPSLLA